MHLSLQNADFETVQKSLASINGIEKITHVSDTETALNVRLSYLTKDDLRAEVYRTIKETDWVLLDFHQETRSLENIFRELTKES